MIYWDTSVIIKLYIKEHQSDSVVKQAKAFDQSIPLTSLHELEITNALQLKKFRNELTDSELERIQSLMRSHEEINVYYRPILDWTSVFQTAMSLSKQYTGTIGSRSLDILHTSAACVLKANSFYTNDGRQSKLAKLAGLKIERIS
jgi:predicted nucleic acid-binding protein